MVKAEGYLVTLTNGDVFKVYSGVDAFNDAYNDASDGSVITLSSGWYKSPQDMKKSLRIIGAGAFGDDLSKCTIFTSFSTTNSTNAYIEGIRFVKMAIGATRNLTVKRCEIDTLQGYEVKDVADNIICHENTLIDQCVVKNDCSFSYSKKHCVKNSTIARFKDGNYEISKENPSTYMNNVVYNVSTGTIMPYAVYKNNILFHFEDEPKEITTYGSLPYYLSFKSSPSEYYYNDIYISHNGLNYLDLLSGCIQTANRITYSRSGFDFYDTLKFPAAELKYELFNGDDGTTIGPYGGTGFSPYPTGPTVVEQNIDSFTDSEGKFKVSIKIHSQQ